MQRQAASNTKMEDRKRRSSSRVRKPTLKLKESLSGSRSASVSVLHQTGSCTDTHENAVIVKDPIQKTTEKQRSDQRSSLREIDCRIKTSLQCKETDIETGKKNVADSNTISKQSVFEPCDPFLKCIDEAAVENTEKEPNSEEKVDLSELDKSQLDFNSALDTAVGQNTIDLMKPEKKRTVQVCLRLKDIMPIRDMKNESHKVIEETTQDGEYFKNVCKGVNKSKKRKLQELDTEKSVVLSDKRKEGWEEDRAFESVVEQTNTIFKEDGSFIETYESKIDCKSLIPSENSLENKKIIWNEASEHRREVVETDKLRNGCKEDEDKTESISRDIDIQTDLELEDFDEADEEVSDFEEAGTENSYECEKCGKVFSSKCSLNKHLALHTGDKPFQCEICGMSFAIKAYLQVHSVVHSGNRKYKCEICGKSFLRRTNLTSHQRSHTDIKAFSCNVCEKKFKTKLGRDSHMKEHGPDLGFRCPQCDKIYSQHAYLLKHIDSIHSGLKPFKCMVCQKSFPYNQSLQEHIRTHTGEKPEVCDKCGKRFNNKRQLRAHMKYHNTISQFSCKDCDMFFDTQQSLNKHLTRTHNRRYECDFCNISFVNKKHLRTHQASNHKDHLVAVRKIPAANLAKAKKVACSLCNKVFFNRYVLSKHLMSKHQLPEQDMKDLLRIRKKAVSKKQMDKYRPNDFVEDFDKVVENDKSFRVYYKDDEMAVYVKGADNFNSRLKAMSEGNHTHVNDSVNNQEVRYIVLEDNNLVDTNEYTEITYSDGANEAIDLKDNVVQSLKTETDEKDIAESITVETSVENMSTSDQNYYVVFTEANGNSDNVVEEIDSKIVTEAEIQNLNDDGAERIVLILNEGEDNKNIMLENGEHYEIITDDTGIICEQNEKQVDEYGIVTTLNDTVNQESLETQARTIIGASNNVETIVIDSNVDVDRHNLPLFEQLQTNENVNEKKSEGTRSKNVMYRDTKDDCPSKIMQHLLTTNAQNEVTPNMQYHGLPGSNHVEENCTLIPAVDDLKPQHSKSTDTNKETTCGEIETTDFEELLPKNNSAQEFAHFESALKSKSGDFQTQAGYNDFIDKMIQTLQKAKQTDPK